MVQGFFSQMRKEDVQNWLQHEPELGSWTGSGESSKEASPRKHMRFPVSRHLLVAGSAQDDPDLEPQSSRLVLEVVDDIKWGLASRTPQSAITNLKMNYDGQSLSSLCDCFSGLVTHSSHPYPSYS